MKVGVIGSGGREHALCFSLKNSDKIKQIYCFPGNAGTGSIATNIDINLNDFEKLKDFIIQNEIDFVIIGPEKPLVDGIVDYLEKFNISVFGPNKIASQLEGSKIFTKKLCEKYKIPTAKFGIFSNTKMALSFLQSCNFPIVIKADGLAAGKGVYISENYTEASKAVG
jgi:phosphoribosylamine--glycine ligase